MQLVNTAFVKHEFERKIIILA